MIPEEHREYREQRAKQTPEGARLFRLREFEDAAKELDAAEFALESAATALEINVSLQRRVNAVRKLLDLIR